MNIRIIERIRKSTRNIIEMVRDSQKEDIDPQDGWKGYYDISEGEYAEIVEIPGFKLRKPLEVELSNDCMGGERDQYLAYHTLPSLNGPEGDMLGGREETKREAIKSLVDTVTGHYTNLEGYAFRDQLEPEQKLQWQYLRSIMTREQGK